MIQIAILILYLIAILVIGWNSWRKSRNSPDQYWVAGRSVGTFANSWAFVAALASGGTVLAMAGTAFTLGISYAGGTTAGAVTGFIIAAILVAGPMRKLGKYTVTDFMVSRFHHGAIKLLVPLLILLTSLAYIVAQLKGAGIVTSHILGLSYEQGVTMTALAFILYVSFGGMNAITQTDVIQGILMTFIVVTLGIAILASSGSITALIHSATASYPSLGSASHSQPITSYLGGFLIWATAVSVTPHIIMRVYTAKNISSAKKSLHISMLIYALMMVIILLVIAPAAAFLSSHEQSDMFFLQLADQYFGPVMRGIVVAGILAAVMSTTDALLLACSSAVAHDLYTQIINPQASEKRKVRIGSLTNWIIGLIALLFALNPPQFIVVLYTTAIGLLSSALFFPMLLGIWWKRMTTPGALAGLLSGALIYLTLFFGFDLPASTEILISLPVSLVFSIAISLLTRRPNTDTLRQMALLHEGNIET